MAYDPQYTNLWSIFIAGKAMRLSEVRVEILDITRKLFEIFNGFYIPTKIGYSLQMFADDTPANSYFVHRIQKSGVIRRELESQEGITFQDLTYDIQNVEIKDVINYIGGIYFKKGKTRFSLKENDLFIDENSSKGFYTWHMRYKDERTDLPTDSPLWISVDHTSTKSGDKPVEVTDPAYYTISIFTETDIWFERTDIGYTNRNRLRKVMKDVYNNFDVIDLSLGNEGVSEELLRSVVFGND